MKINAKSIGAAALAAIMCVSFTGCKPNLEKQLENAANEINKELNKSNTTTSKTTTSKNTASNAKTVDPFENLTLTYDGMAPTATAKVNGGNPNVNYTLTPDKNLKNGDTITVTAEAKSSVTEISLTETTKEFTVEGLAGYATKLDDISDEMKTKLEKQSDDLVTALSAKTFSDYGTVKNKQLLGYYFLSAKEGVNTDKHNSVYLVYKITSNIKYLVNDNGSTAERNKDISTYTYCKFDNITVMPDGTVSADIASGTIYDNTYEIDYVQYVNLIAVCWRIPGYKDIDSMFNDVVAKNVAEYTYENTVEDVAETTSSTTSSATSSSATSSATSSAASE